MRVFCPVVNHLAGEKPENPSHCGHSATNMLNAAPHYGTGEIDPFPQMRQMVQIVMIER
jgi:hypothetical protein